MLWITGSPWYWNYYSYLKLWLETQELELLMLIDSWLEDDFEYMKLKIERLVGFVAIVHFVGKELFLVFFDACIFHLRSDDSIRTNKDKYHWKKGVLEITLMHMIFTKNLQKSIIITFVLAFKNISFSIFLANPQRLICSALDIPGKTELIAWILSQI